MKAVLVIDMPKNCDECPLERWGIDGWNCTPMNQVIEDDKPEWCPLRPLPHKLQADWYTDGYKEGFNACLEEITEETE